MPKRVHANLRANQKLIFHFVQEGSFLWFFLGMSNIRPQQTPQQPEQSTTTQLPPGTVSIDKIWNLGITLTLFILILVVGFFMTRGFWRFAMHKLDDWLGARRGQIGTVKKKTKVVVQEEEPVEDDEEEEEVEEVVVVKKKAGNARRR